jgi:predicted cytidylate kinase
MRGAALPGRGARAVIVAWQQLGAVSYRGRGFLHMVSQRSIVVSGDLGSGKSTVSVEVAARLGLRRISVGDLYREMAQSRGMSALQLNLHAELDDAVDGYVDELQSEVARSDDEQLVVDGRLAWFFFTKAFKVHLITDPAVAAQRVLLRPSDDVEAYSSLAEARERLGTRSESERARFLTRYGVDKNRLRNYDMVCDTTRVSPDQIVDRIVAAFSGQLGQDIISQSPPLLLLDPSRIFPTRLMADGGGFREPGPPSGAGRESAPLPPIAVGYAGTSFYVIDGHRRLSAALHRGLGLVAARLLAEGEERVAGGLTSLQYFDTRVDLGKIRAWESAHQIDLPLPERLREPARESAGDSAPE